MTEPARREIGTLQVIRLVAGREVGERLRAKSFYILTGLLVVIIIGIGVVSRFAADDGPERIEVAVVEAEVDELAEAVARTAGQFERDVEVTSYPDAGAGTAALRDGDVDVLLDGDSSEVLFDDTVDQEVVAILQQAWSGLQVQQNLETAGLSPEQAAAALSPEPLEASTLDGDEDDSTLAVLTGTIAVVLLFISLQTFGGYVLTGVVEEKSTAVVELLLARVRADQLLAGKVIGIGIAALLQFAVAVAAALVSLSVSGVDVPGEIWSAVPMTLVWFLTGYAFYSMMFALAGSLVSRQEDAQAASAPIMTALIGAYLAVFFFGYVPESTVSRIMSVVPPIAPLLMPMRMAAGAATVIEVVAALVLLLASIWGVWKLTGRIYAQVLLRRGSRISWRDAMAIATGR